MTDDPMSGQWDHSGDHHNSWSGTTNGDHQHNNPPTRGDHQPGPRGTTNPANGGVPPVFRPGPPPARPRRKRRRKQRQSIQPCAECGRLTAHQLCQHCESAQVEREHLPPQPEDDPGGHQ